jgi:hypothetical protein
VKRDDATSEILRTASVAMLRASQIRARAAEAVRRAAITRLQAEQSRARAAHLRLERGERRSTASPGPPALGQVRDVGAEGVEEPYLR